MIQDLVLHNHEDDTEDHRRKIGKLPQNPQPQKYICEPEPSLRKHRSDWTNILAHDLLNGVRNLPIHVDGGSAKLLPDQPLPNPLLLHKLTSQTWATGPIHLTQEKRLNKKLPEEKHLVTLL